MDNNKNKLMTPANIVTIIRICFVPLFVFFLLAPWPYIFDESGSLNYLRSTFSLIIFIILSLTDSLDGYLARSRNEISDFGKFMDPLADKILVFSALIALVELSVLPSWVVLIILMREFIVSGIRMLAASKGEVIAASWYGKAKTITQIIAIILFLLCEVLNQTNTNTYVYILNIFAWIILIIALILTIVSMLDYIYKSKDIFFNKGEDISYDSKIYAEKIINICLEKGITISSAESITAGQISNIITSVSGSSDVFIGGVASYSYCSKNNLLNIDTEFLKKNGAVNKKCSKLMAYGILNRLNSDYSVSTTGIAGPNSDEFKSPIGRVYICVCSKSNYHVYKCDFKGKREQIRDQTTDKALYYLLKFIEQN